MGSHIYVHLCVNSDKLMKAQCFTWAIRILHQYKFIDIVLLFVRLLQSVSLDGVYLGCEWFVSK
jgi:hypothetical protein